LHRYADRCDLQVIFVLTGDDSRRPVRSLAS
jgi:hypothetical protein